MSSHAAQPMEQCRFQSVQGRGASRPGIENTLRYYVPEVIEVRPL